MKYKFAFFLILSFLGFSQNKINQEIDSISTSLEAKAFIKSNKIVKGKIVIFNKEKHKTRLAKELFEVSNGGKKVYKTDNSKTYYKVLERKQVPHYKASIILFDGKKTQISEINSLRAFIFKGYNDGAHKFENLARVYSKHPSGKTGGDLGWLKNGIMSKRFEQSLKDHKVGKIYSFDEHREKKHYVMLKTEEEQNIEEITVLKITESIK